MKDKANYLHNLYYTQHKWLPFFFYGGSKRTLDILLKEKGQLFVDLFHAMHKDERSYSCPITAEDFQISKRNNSTITIVRIGMPLPPKELYCRSVYLCFDSKNKHSMYYTVELNTSGSYFIGAWVDNGGHFIFDMAPDNPDDEFDRIEKHFMATLEEPTMSYTPPINA